MPGRNRTGKSRRLVLEGRSMGPFVLPGSAVHVRPIAERPIRLGDILCYIGPDKRVIAHRVIGIERQGDDTWYRARGDAHTASERIAPHYGLYRVERVESALLSYDTDGAVGRAIARFQLRDGRLWEGMRRLTREGWRLACAVRSAMR